MKVNVQGMGEGSVTQDPAMRESATPGAPGDSPGEGVAKLHCSVHMVPEGAYNYPI